MADYGSEYNDAMGALNQMIASQQAQANQKPTGIFSNVDPVMLGLAQGLLSPTKTGGFGESVGLGIAGAEGPLAAMKKQQLDAQGKIQELQLARAKLAMEAPYYQARAAHLAGLGSGGGSLGTPYSQMSALTAELKSLQNADDETLAALEAKGIDVNQAKADIISQMAFIRSKMGGGKGATIGSSPDETAASASSGGVPEVKSEADYGKIGPGERFMYKGKLYQKPEAPADQPRG